MKIKSIFLFSLFGLTFLLPTDVISQTESTDAWLSTTLGYEILDDLDIKIELGHRRENFYSSRLYSDLVLKYKLNDFAKIGMAWRHSAEPDPFDVEDLSNRFNVDFSGKVKRNDIGLNYRLRYQTKYNNWTVSEDGTTPTQTVRTRLLLEYKLNKDWQFDAGSEAFIRLSYNEPYYLNKVRYIAGFEYRINKSQVIALHYILQKEVQEANPHTSHIISVDYSVDVKRVLKKLKKKRKKKRKAAAK